MSGVGFGRTNPFPRRFGGGVSVIEIEMRAILDAMEPAFNPDDSTANAAEAYAEAMAIAWIWACNNRLSKQAQPLKMTDSFADWETACRLRPTGDDLDTQRRARLAAVLRGIAGNAPPDIIGAASTLLGATFTGVVSVSQPSTIVYWPGGPAIVEASGNVPATAPGPPGYEWASNRTRITVNASPGGLSNGAFSDLMDRLMVMLDAMTPTWMTFGWSTGSGFLVGVSSLGYVSL